jgi:hypothetical protein
MLCALTVRRLKPGSYGDFMDAFGPPDGAVPPGWTRFHALRSLSNPDEVVTFGFFDGTIEELEASQRDHGYEERRGSAREFVEEVIVNGVYDIVEIREPTPA